jgi:hypothetical protein
MKMKLLSPDPGEGGDPVPPGPPPSPVTSTPPPAPPPAASTVLQGTKSERELQLEDENQKLLAEKKKVETRAAELEDENHRLKQIPAVDQPAVNEDEGKWKLFEV